MTPNTKLTYTPVDYSPRKSWTYHVSTVPMRQSARLYSQKYIYIYILVYFCGYTDENVGHVY